MDPHKNLCTVCLYLSDGGAVGHARRVWALIVRIVEGFLIRGDLILPIDPVVTQLGHPFIKQVLLFNLKGGKVKNTQVFYFQSPVANLITPFVLFFR